MAAVSVTPASGTAKMTVVRVNVTGLDDTDFSSYNVSNKPAEPELRYYIEATLGGTRQLKSHEFSPAQDGTHAWNGIALPAAGTWTFNVNNSTTDATAATTTFVAS